MSYFPFYYDIRDKEFLLIGGGSIAADKFMKLKAFTDNIRIIAKQTDIEWPRITLREYRSSDLEGADYCIAATGEPAVDARIASDCREKGIPVNVVDNAKLCDFIFPAVIKKGRLLVSVSTSGASPAYARLLKEKIERLLPSDIEAVLEEMYELRGRLKAENLSQKERADIYKKKLEELLGV